MSYINAGIEGSIYAYFNAGSISVNDAVVKEGETVVAVNATY